MRSVLSVVAAAAVLSGMAAAQNASWSVIASNLATTATGIAFTSATTGYMPADQNGEGTVCLKSTDGGRTWAATEHNEVGLILLDIAAYGNNVVISDVLAEYYSNDGGATFQTSQGSGQSQSIRTVSESGNQVGFITAGLLGWNGVNGVGVSTDNGATFTDYNAQLGTDARYVAAPASGTWFVSAGQWPGESEITNMNRSARVYVEKMEDGSLRTRLRQGPGNYGAKGKWVAQISRTTNGGSSWTLVFNSTGTFYFNGIAAWDTNHVCAVGEADAGSSPGSRILCSTDGGQTWNQTLFNAGGDNSLIDIAVIPGTPGAAWACGGDMSGFGVAQWYLTRNYGQTWTLGGSVDGQYASSITCDPSGSGACWSTLLDVITQEASVAGTA